MEVDRATRAFCSRENMEILTSDGCFINHLCFLSKRAASPSYIQEQKELKER